jgi:acyl carrier protein
VSASFSVSNDNLEQVKLVLASALSLGKRIQDFTPATPLLGNLPELDSMAVIGVITALEEQFKFKIADDEISAEIFSTLGSLTLFVDSKLRS